MNRYLAAIFLFLPSLLFAAGDDPSGYFGNPLDSELVLKGTFGEIRPDHLHSGIDLATDEVTGKPVHASADGYVSRIKVSATGFGKAIYITHPNGYVTVYGHLQSFNPEIAERTLAEQKRLESFEVDFLLKKKELKIKKGEVIALSGNTGGSEGPHLHFEIRDEKSEEPINPLLLGIPVKDTIAPVITGFRVFPKLMQGTVELSDQPASYPVEWIDGQYKVKVPGYLMTHGLVAFGVEAYDKANGSNAILGPSGILLTSGADTIYRLVMDQFNFSDSRAANGLIDYAYEEEENTLAYRCYRLPGIPALGVLKSTGAGFLELTDEHAHELDFTVSDAAGNKAVLKVEVLAAQAYGQIAYTFPPYGQVLVSPFQGTAVHKLRSHVIIPKGAVYDTCYLDIHDDASTDPGIYSDIITAGDPSIPLHNAMTVGLRPTSLADSLLTKAVVVRLESRFVSLGGEWVDGFLDASSRRFGRFGLALDTIAPVVKLLFDTTATTDTISFVITDNLSGIQSYRAELNGHWMLMEYDAKSNTLEGVLPKEALPGVNDFVLAVTDNRKNASKFTYRIIRPEETK